MVKTCRNSTATSPLTMDPNKLRKALTELNMSSNAIHGACSFKEVLCRMLTELFSHGIAGFWFHILPVIGENDDVCACLGVCPVFNCLGLTGHDVTSTVKSCHVVLDQWDELLQSIQKFVCCQISHCRTRRGGKTSFLLLGEPRFSNPLKQQQEGGALICLEEEQGRRMARSLVRKLKVDIKNSAQRILRSRDCRRVTANNTRAGNGNANQGDDENELETAAVIDLVSDDLNEKIEHANALDSDRCLDFPGQMQK